MLKKVDSNEGLSMPSIYNDIYRAKLAIKAIHGDDERKYGPFWSVIDNHWSAVFHHPLYAAANYFLNSSYRYRPDFMALPEVIRGLNECSTRLEPDNGRRVSAASQISWKGVTSKWVEKLNSSAANFIEFVTSPNNPDGRLQQPVLQGSSVIYDHAYYWPHFSAIKAPADGDLMLFTISKLMGHAGSRFGWTVVKDEGVYKRMLSYLGINTMGVSRDTHLRSLKLLKALLAEERGADKKVAECIAYEEEV